MFTVDYCGYNTHNSDCDIIYRPNGSSSHLFLLILSPMNFEINGVKSLVNPGACILYTPGFPQRYQAVKEFINSFVHFYLEELLERYAIPFNTIFYPEETNEINWFIKKIHTEYLTKQLHHEEQIDSLMRQLLIHMDREYQKVLRNAQESSSLFSDFQSLRLQMLTYCEEDWSIERMCQMVNLEKSQLYSYYNKFFYTTPKEELINARIDKAKYLLTNEALQINQVALKSGFSDACHFSRSFKKKCGCTPNKFGLKQQK